MKVFALIGVYLVVAEGSPMDESLSVSQPTDYLSSEWELYTKDYNKNYNTNEKAKRINIYAENMKKITEHNKKFNQGQVTFKVDINQFTDMLTTEVKASMNGYTGGIKKSGIRYVDNGLRAAATVDWRTKGVVTSVKNQGQCGSCWSFSTTGSLEGMYALKTGRLVSLSEQNLVDCSKTYGNAGCNGGSMDQSFQYIKYNNGIDTEKSYPYTAKDGRCRFNSKNVGATLSGYVNIPQGDEQSLMNAISKVGPISVAIDASNWSFQMYSGGVYNEPLCSSSLLDHAVLVVGYGTENGQDYWLVKNSWGLQWGEMGYIRMTRNSNNQCGIASQASYPTVALNSSLTTQYLKIQFFT